MCFSIRNVLVERLDNFRFSVKKFLMIFKISEISMSGKDVSIELSKLAMHKDVLEFGSGGSTILLSKSANRVVSIESDKFFSAFMKRQLHKNKIRNVEIQWVDIGPTVRYGFPNPRKKDQNTLKYVEYTEKPFIHLKELAFEPELIFIDGRFRVWCAIQSVRKIDWSFTMVFDDFFLREQYFVIKEFLGEPLVRIDNAAVFKIEDTEKTRYRIPPWTDKYQFDPE